MKYGALFFFAITLTCIFAACSNEPKAEEKVLSEQDKLMVVDTSIVAPTLPTGLQIVNGMEVRFSANWNNQYAGVVYTGLMDEGAPAIIIPPIDDLDDVNNGMTQAFVEFFRRSGFVVLTYDRAGCGQSKGNWEFIFLRDEAKEIQAAAKELARYALVDKNNIGVLIYGRNTLISTLGAANAPETSFSIAVDIPLDGYEKAALADANFEASKGKPQRLKTLQALFQYMKDSNWEAYRTAALKLTDSAPSDLYLPDDKEVNVWNNLNEYQNMDISDYMHCLNKPTLQIWGQSSPSFVEKDYQAHLNRIQSVTTCEIKPTTLLLNANLYPDYGGKKINAALLDSIDMWLVGKQIGRGHVDNKVLPI